MDQGLNNEKYEITQIKGGTDNCYLISDGKSAILFDTSSGASVTKVIEECSKYEMKLLVLSHPHFDHAENAAVISERFNIPVAYHEADDEIFDDYDAQPLKSYGIVGKAVLMLSLKVLRNSTVLLPENHFFIKEGDSLSQYGIDADIIELPGHTNGSVGVDVEGKSLIAGDALDNWIFPATGHLYYDIDSLKKSADRISSIGERTVYYGHGKETKNSFRKI